MGSLPHGPGHAAALAHQPGCPPCVGGESCPRSPMGCMAPVPPLLSSWDGGWQAACNVPALLPMHTAGAQGCSTRVTSTQTTALQVMLLLLQPRARPSAASAPARWLAQSSALLLPPPGAPAAGDCRSAAPSPARLRRARPSPADQAGAELSHASRPHAPAHHSGAQRSTVPPPPCPPPAPAQAPLQARYQLRAAPDRWPRLPGLPALVAPALAGELRPLPPPASCSAPLASRAGASLTISST